MNSKRLFSLGFLAAFFICGAHGQTRPDPTRFNWPLVTGYGVPSISCGILNYGQPYTDLTHNTQYYCFTSGWIQSGGAGGSPGGSSAQIQWNSSATFAGASGGTTDGTNFALGGTSLNGASGNNPNPTALTAGPATIDTGATQHGQLQTFSNWAPTSGPTPFAGSSNLFEQDTDFDSSGASDDTISYYPNLTYYDDYSNSTNIKEVSAHLVVLEKNGTSAAGQDDIYGANGGWNATESNLNITAGSINSGSGLAGTAILNGGNACPTDTDPARDCAIVGTGGNFEQFIGDSSRTYLAGVQGGFGNVDGGTAGTISGLMAMNSYIDPSATVQVNAGLWISILNGEYTDAVTNYAILSDSTDLSKFAGAMEFDSTVKMPAQAAGSGDNCLQIDTAGNITKTGVACGSGGAGVSSVALTVPSWLTVTGSPVTSSGTLAVAPTTAQTSHQVIGTCGTATTFGPCTLVAGDIPTAIPIANVGSAGLSGTSPIAISSAGAISIQVANTSQNGYLASADWNTFNGKQNALSLIAGTYTNGDWCSYASSGTLLNCNNAAPQVNLSLIKGTYTNTDLCTYTTSGTLLNCTTATSTFQTALSLLAGTYVDGDLCSYTASGTLLNCNTAPGGTGNMSDGSGTSASNYFPLTNGTAHDYTPTSPSATLAILGAAPALGNNVPQTTSFTIVVNTVYRFTGSGASNATTPASVTTGFIASIWNQGTAAVTVVTGGPTLVCVPSTCIVPIGAAASITTDGTNFDVQISNALGSAFGTAANVNTGTSGATIPLLNGANTWGGLQTFGTNFSVGGVTATGATGTGNVVFSISPALTGTPDASGATQFKLPVASSFASAANGETGYDTTNKNWHLWGNGVDNFNVIVPVSTSITNGHCSQWALASGTLTLVDAGSSCGSDSGGGTSGWSGTPLTFISTATQYAPPVGGSLTSATESVADVASPVAQTISNLSVSLSAALGAGATLQVTFRDGGVSEALTCTTASGGASCVDSTHSFNVAKGDLIDFQLVSSGTVTAGVPQIVITYAAGTSSVGVTAVTASSPIVSSGGSTPNLTGPTIVTSAASLTSNALMTGAGGQGSQTITTGTGVTTALGVNPGSAGAVGVLIATGTAAMNTSAIASGACATVVTVAGSGIATTDVIEVGFNGDPTAVTGYGASATGAVLTIYLYPTSGNVNIKVCNSTASSITPGALTLNWKVYR